MSEINWPSAAKRHRLRQQGVVPISSVALRCVLLVIVAGFVFSWKAEFLPYLSYAEWKTGALDEQLVSSSTGILRMLGDFFIALALTILGTVILFGLLQTRFFFRPALCMFDFSRLWRNPARGLVAATIRVLCVLCLAAGITLGIAYSGFSSLIGAFNLGSERILTLLPNQAPGAAFLFFGVCTLVIAGIAQLHFFWTHRMSREEMEREARER